MYSLKGITVEAEWPDWEAKLSPGSVTVIRPEDFKGDDVYTTGATMEAAAHELKRAGAESVIGLTIASGAK